MICLEYVPTYDELNNYYGDPDFEPGEPDPSFMAEHSIRIALPFGMKLSWKPKVHTLYIRIHRRIAEAVKDALQEIKDYKGPSYVMDKGYNYFGGTYSYRLTRGGDVLTTHAWCVAIDMNPHLAPYRRKDNEGNWINRQPEFITNAFLKRGFVTFVHDGMHFQAVMSLSKSAVYYGDVIGKINGGG